jgi:hypothetical protein
MDLIRQHSYFDPMVIKKEVHVIGVGAVGSHVVNALTRLGIEKINIWDFDVVGSHNIPNQAFEETDIGSLKIDAISKTLQRINAEVTIKKHGKYTNELLTGFVFVCVDSIKVRKLIYEQNQYNTNVIAMFDTRIGLDDGQVLAAEWTKDDEIQNLIEMSSFEETESHVPVSACGSKLTVLPTVIMASNIAISNFITFVKTGTLKRTINFNAFDFKIRAF